jgi:putative colanic acid biosynthesis acetyltransferase WcaF
MQGKTDLSKYNNSDYRPGSIFKRSLWYVVNWLFFKQALSLSNGIKCMLLRAFGAKVGKGVIIKPCVNIKYPWFLSIGNHVWIGEEVWIDNLGEVTIGNHVCISQGAMLLSGNHNYKSSYFELIVDKIVLEEGVWIGAKAVVCQGVTCRSHAFLTVGSIAISNLEEYGIYRGNPAQKVKERTVIAKQP